MTENLTTNLETQIEDSGAVNEESESQTISETDTESKPQEVSLIFDLIIFNKSQRFLDKVRSPTVTFMAK